MNFSEALKVMKMGSKVSREAWRGINSFWYIPSGQEEIFQRRPDGKEGKVRLLDWTENEPDFYKDDDWWVVT